MKPRQYKKLCKKVFEIAGSKFGKPYIDEEPFADLYMNPEEHNPNCTMSHILVVGGGFDSYLGDAVDPTPLFDCAREHVLWEFGQQNICPVKDEHGKVIDECPSWPIYKTRLTGKEVIQKLRVSI